MINFTIKNIKKYKFILRIKYLRDKTGVFIGRGSSIAVNTKISDGTRINGKITIKGAGYCKIGKFCAIGDGVKIITSNHDTNAVNLQFRLQKMIGLRPKNSPKKHINIGHNVWIGDNVIILPGVSIGNGAVLAAGSVVTKNVSPYTIAGGSPAKHIDYRFSKQKIKTVEESNWWDWTLSKMKENKKFFM